MATVLILILVSPALASAEMEFNQIISFGASLSDPGNAFVLTGEQMTPPYNALYPQEETLLIPGAPYAKGGHHFSNGATWVEQFAQDVGLAGDANSAFLWAGTNYAVGGARARYVGDNNLYAQINLFMADFGPTVSGDALYTMEFGGNDIRDALAAFDPVLAASDPDAALVPVYAILFGAVNSIDSNIRAIYAAGARKFLVWNAPDIGLIPAMRILDNTGGVSQFATAISGLFNVLLVNAVYGPGGLNQLEDIEIEIFDAYGIIQSLVYNIDNQADYYGLTDVTSTCVQPKEPPFHCKNPDEYLFWDGIHPTKAVHAILAQKAAELLGDTTP